METLKADMRDQPELNVDEGLKALRERYDGYRSLLGSARKNLISMLGQTYEAACTFAHDDEAMRKLRLCADTHAAIKARPRWTSEGKSAAALLLLLMTIHDEEAAASRSQWQSAIEGAQRLEIDPTESAFVELVKRTEGGLRSLGKRSDDAGTANDNLKDNLDTVHKLKPERSKITMDLAELSFFKDVSILVVEKTGDGGTVELLESVSDPRRVLSMAAFAADRLKKKENRDFEERKLIWELNRFTLMYAKAPWFNNEEVTGDSAITFMTAYNALRHDPEWNDRYGLAGTRLGSMEITSDPHVNHGKFEVVDKSFHKWDPGRYIHGTTQNRLVPYSLDGNDDDREAAMKGYYREYQSFAKAYWAARRKKGGGDE